LALQEYTSFHGQASLGMSCTLCMMWNLGVWAYQLFGMCAQSIMAGGGVLALLQMSHHVSGTTAISHCNDTAAGPTCGSTIRGHRLALLIIMAFSTLTVSVGRPAMVQART
jgi:hypothetical protein